MIPRKGAEVARITEKDLRDVLEVRYAGHKVKLTPDVQIFQTFDGVQFGVEICSKALPHRCNIFCKMRSAQAR